MSFTAALGIADIRARYRALNRRLMAMRAVIIVLLIAAVSVVGYPLILQWQSARNLAATSNNAAEQVAGWPYPQAERVLEAARDYNKRLAERGQSILGEVADPFTTQTGESKTSDADDSAASQDEDYQSQLNAGRGVMGTIRVPEASIELPIYHGTSDTALAHGAGHLYGTSLPVGGKSTHSVITGHRGLVSAAMFTRLDELEPGDFFYIEVMGKTLGYKVDRITVIKPDDTSKLTIVPGEDRVTLMTCTPYGVNTHRLLVSGHRVSVPNPAPDPTNLHDARTLGIWTAVGTFAAGWASIRIARYIRRSRRDALGIARHVKPAPSHISHKASARSKF